MTAASLEGQRAVVVGGSRGIGRGIVEALAAAGARTVVVARGRDELDALHEELGVEVVAGDAEDEALAARLLESHQPDILVLNAGVEPAMGPLTELSWEEFSGPWNHDVKLGFVWMRAALKQLRRGRVLVMSSGAAVGGSPLSGGYAGAKRMLWFMADYAQGAATELDRDLSFQTLVPMQMLAATGVGVAGASAYATRKGITKEAFLAGFGPALTPRAIGEHVVEVVTEPRYATPRAFRMKGDTPLGPFD